MSKIDLDKFIGALREHLGYLQHNLVDAIDASLREQGIGIYDRIVVKEGEQKDPCENCDYQMLNCQNFPCDKKQGKLKSAEWSEEDKEKIKEIKIAIYNQYDEDKAENLYYYFLEPILYGVRSQLKKKWSEEDEFIRLALLKIVKNEMKQHGNVGLGNGIITSDIIAWLKSLKERYTWKPSDEQITWLYRAADDAIKNSRMKQVLNNLLSDLKKLREV